MPSLSLFRYFSNIGYLVSIDTTSSPTFVFGHADELTKNDDSIQSRDLFSDDAFLFPIYPALDPISSTFDLAPVPSSPTNFSSIAFLYRFPDVTQSPPANAENSTSFYRRFLEELEAQPAISDPNCDFSTFNKWKGDRVFEISDEVDDADAQSGVLNEMVEVEKKEVMEE